jgi:hypothetical protein
MMRPLTLVLLGSISLLAAEEPAAPAKVIRRRGRRSPGRRSARSIKFTSPHGAMTAKLTGKRLGTACEVKMK